MDILDSDVLDAAKDSDFQKIYAELMPVLFKVAYNIVRAEDIAEDLCHDSLIKMVEKQMQFPSLNDAKFWLIRVVKNASLNQVKRKGRERKAQNGHWRRSLLEDGNIENCKYCIGFVT